MSALSASEYVALMVRCDIARRDREAREPTVIYRESFCFSNPEELFDEIYETEVGVFAKPRKHWEWERDEGFKLYDYHYEWICFCDVCGRVLRKWSSTIYLFQSEFELKRKTWYESYHVEACNRCAPRLRHAAKKLYDIRRLKKLTRKVENEIRNAKKDNVNRPASQLSG